MLLYDRFYRRFGVRKLENLIRPRIAAGDLLALPRGSIFHYLSEDSLHQGLPGDDWLLRDIDRLVMVDHVKELKGDKGNPRFIPSLDTKMIREYHQKNRKLKPVRNLQTQVRDERTLLVVNYALLPSLYRYTQTVYTSYYRWANVETTVWDKVNEMAKTLPERQQFRRIELPPILPTLQMLNKAERNFTRQMLDVFTTPESLLLLELWKWIGDNRSQSLMAGLSQEAIQRLNFIFQYRGYWFTLNFGAFDSWISRDGSAGLKPVRAQKVFLKMLMHLYSTGTGDESDGGTDGTNTTTEKDGEEDQESTQAGSREPLIEAYNDTIFDGLDFDELEVEKDLDALNDLFSQIEAEEESQLPTPVTERTIPSQDVDYGKGVMARAEALAGDGLLSAAEMRRFEALAEQYKKLPNPYGKGTLAEQAKVTLEDLKMPEPTPMPDSERVLDKSMLKSSLNDFDSRYIDRIMSKDMTNCVLSLQQTGFAITGYDVEEVEDAVNHYEIHTLRVTPVNGSPSTIRFRIPKVQEDGSYLANGVKYRMRKQRGDVPIRKINARRVALTSYYGRVFVDRSEKATDDFPRWLVNNITRMGLDKEDNTVHELKVANVYDSQLKLPRLYSMLAEQFSQFQVKDMAFFVDYHKRQEFFGQDVVDKVEASDMVIIGKQGTTPIVVDYQDSLYKVVNGEPEPMGRLEELLELDISKSPLEVAELKVFGKNLPLGMVLGYYLGLDGLLSQLNITTRRVRAGERLTLDSREYALRFEDITLVASRDDQLATMLLSGFDRFKKTIKAYPISDFNRPDIYTNVFEQNGLGVRYTRELNLLRDMFIDPITRDLLVEMEEPTEWIPLLFRSAELLLTDYAPAETDLNYMRIKGYERMPGTVYMELVKAARMFHARQGGNKNQLDISPHAIWQSIQEDPSKSLVEESNPIQNLKEKEVVTYGGTGGRSRRTLVKRNRIYHPSDMGTISEATPDSGDVGVNTYMTANPNLTTLRGMTKRYDKQDDGPASLLSTSALLSPAADSDDPKRVKFSPITQQCVL